MLLVMRSIAWIARGFRGPLRDYMLSDAVETTHYGRAFGLERAADMVGAIAGPLTATLLVYLGIQLKSIILVALIPGVLAASSMYFLAKERMPDTGSSAQATAHADKPRFPRAYWLFLVGVLLFGLGDFSRTFLILIAAGGLKENGALASGTLSIAVLLYAMHNLVSALTAYPVGRLGDKMSKRRILVVGYGLGVLTNLLLALAGGSLPMIIAAIALSGVYIAIEETLEKATVASLLPRELKSLGFGILACANAVGDMASSLYVGSLMSVGRSTLAFGIAAGLGSLGVVWMMAIAFQASRGAKAASQT
jgi:MFS family permease